jgi:ATP/maltotriose-dependent transcriptional regulator MalT
MGLHAAHSNALAIMESFVEAVESALRLDRLDTARDLFARVENLGPGESSQSIDAQRRRLGARLAVRLGEADKADQGFKRAAASFRELAVPFWLGVTLLEHGEWLVAEGRADEAEPLLGEARQIFERLGAVPYLERCEPTRTPELEPA